MTTALKVSRLQKRGQVTIPIEIRQRLGLEEGDMVAFVETDEGIVISPQEMLPTDALNQMASYLADRGVGLEELFGFVERLGETRRATDANDSQANDPQANDSGAVAGDVAAGDVARQTAGIFRRRGQKPMDFDAQRREFEEGTARRVRGETSENTSESTD